MAIVYNYFMPRIPCKLCGLEFYSKPSWIKKGDGKYCSMKCSSQARRTGKTIKCFLCKRSTYKKKIDFQRSDSGKLFCSKRCSLKWKNTTFIGPKHNNWKHGGNSDSYRNILKRSGRPRKCQICNNEDLRVLDVHHRDGNRRNNSLKNLTWLCCNCHFLVHHYITEADNLKN